MQKQGPKQLELAGCCNRDTQRGLNHGVASAFCCGCEHAEATFRPTNLRLRGEPMKSSGGYTKFVGSFACPADGGCGRCKPGDDVAAAALPIGADRECGVPHPAEQAHTSICCAACSISSRSVSMTSQPSCRRRASRSPWSTISPGRPSPTKPRRTTGAERCTRSFWSGIPRARRCCPIWWRVSTSLALRSSSRSVWIRYFAPACPAASGVTSISTSATAMASRSRRPKQLHGSLENVNVQNVPGVGHITIDKNEIMQRRVISAIDAVAFGGRPSEASAAPKPEARAAR